MVLLRRNDKVSQEMDDKFYSIGIFLDLSKVFDTIDHSILLDNLYCYGVRGNVYHWIESYQSYMYQYVHVSNVTSSHQPVVCGVPQGSVLEPPLFISARCNIYTVSQKNANDVLRYNFNAHQPILIIFGRDIAE